MAKPRIVAGNWKLNKNPVDTEEYFDVFQDLTTGLSSEQKKSFVFFPPTLCLQSVSENLKPPMGFGPQNIYFEEAGAFTGETSASACKDIGATHALVGHSERRKVFGESDEWTSKKVARAQAAGLIPVLCVGETLEEREQNQTWAVVEKQLQVGLSAASNNVWIAYEPVWAIGTGKVATPEQAEEVHKNIRQFLAKKFTGATIPILYGGSVTPENAAALYKQNNIDGFLVGGASLKPDVFFQISKSMA